jgi:predicted DNA-binding protein
VLYTALYMPSTRTQIYLSAEQRRLLDARGRATGAPLAKMIRDAVDAYLTDESPDLDVALDQTFGSLPEFELPSRGDWEASAHPGR